MAFNRKWFNIFKTLLPKSEAFSIIIQKWLTKFFEGLTAIPDDFRTFIDNIYMDLFPFDTRSPELWEEQFGIRIISSNDTTRRTNIDIQWKLKGGQSAKYIQDKLQDAGYNVQVHENNPQVDPDIFCSSDFIMTCDNIWAVCGNDDAFCGKSGGLILANGYIPQTSDLRDYLAVCDGDGHTPTCCGRTTSLCGYFEQFIVEPKVYAIPDDDDYWGFVFFIGGDAIRNAITHELESIENVQIPENQRIEFERLILKLKPVHTWCGLMIDYT
jgi:hypothetical protein